MGPARHGCRDQHPFIGPSITGPSPPTPQKCSRSHGRARPAQPEVRAAAEQGWTQFPGQGELGESRASLDTGAHCAGDSPVEGWRYSRMEISPPVLWEWKFPHDAACATASHPLPVALLDDPSFAITQTSPQRVAQSNGVIASSPSLPQTTARALTAPPPSSRPPAPLNLRGLC